MARTATSTTAGGVARAGRLGMRAVGGSARAVAGIFDEPEVPAGRSVRAPAIAFTGKIPFASASLRLPGPGAAAALGPVHVRLPAGAVYYGGLGTLVIAGALDLPVAAGAALAGAVFGRRWLRGPGPEVSRSDGNLAAAAPSGSNGAAPSA